MNFLQGWGRSLTGLAQGRTGAERWIF